MTQNLWCFTRTAGQSRPSTALLQGSASEVTRPWLSRSSPKLSMWISARWWAGRRCRGACSSTLTGRCRRRQGRATGKPRRLCVRRSQRWAAWRRRTDVGASLSQPQPGIKPARTSETSRCPGFRVALQSPQLHRRVGKRGITIITYSKKMCLCQASTIFFACIIDMRLVSQLCFSIRMNPYAQRLQEDI